jgi:exonuclease SbcC
MRLRHLCLRGFTGIRHGLGLDELTLDLAHLHGIVALVGPNGSGKTTTLECLQPFRTLPSRGISLKDAVGVRDAHKDLSFDFAGHRYRVLVTVDARTGKSDGFLWRDDEPLTSGKISELDEQLRSVLGSPEWFFHSVFAAQAAGSLLDLRPALRKDFFAEFLGLTRLQTYADTARQVAVFVEAWAAGIAEEARRLAQEVEEIPALEAELRACEGQAAEQEGALRHMGEEEQHCQTALDQARQRALQAEAAAKTLRYWQEQKAAILNAAHQQRARLRAEQQQATQEDHKLEREMHVLYERLRAVETHSATEPHLMQEQAELQTKMTALETEAQEIHQTVDAQCALAELRATFHREEARLNATLTERTRLAEALTTRPAEASDDLCRQCGLAQAAWQACTEAETLRQQIHTLRMAQVEKEAPVLARLPQGLRPLSTVAAELKAARARLQTIQTLLGQRQRSEQLRQDLQAKVALRQLHQQTIARTTSALAELETALQADVHRIEAEIAQAQTACHPEITQAVRTAEQRFTGVVQRLSVLRDALACTRATMTTLAQRLRDRHACQERLAEVERQLVRCRCEYTEWASLAQLCGRDKLQALELDAAAPAISQYGNLLLGRCFGGRFSLAFRTLDEQDREVFDIVVRNSISGEELDLRLMSGGEKTIVLHALRLALTLYAKERSGRDFRTIFCDEVDGQLYSEVRREFLEMNRAAMRLGGFETMFLVSHSPEVIDGADHLISFSEGQVTVS